MSRNMSHAVLLCGTVLALSLTNTAAAQWFPFGDPCRCVQPVAQACYQTVPVTEYRQVRQTVRRPVVETKYVDQTVTEYRPVVDTKTATVPTITYENVTDHQTVYRNAGYWQTHYQCNPKLSPCQYDPRPNLAGWLNRTSYSVRSAFTPRVVARRQYVPQVVAQVVPVTRQVARHGTKQITYKVTRYEPHPTTRKVAVNTVRYVDDQVVSTQPVTVMRSVPIGTSVAYAVSPYGVPTATALQPSPDPIGTARQNSPTRSADRQNDGFGGNRYERDATNVKPDSSDETSLLQNSSGASVTPAGYDEPAEPQARRQTASNPARHGARRPVPSIVRLNRWAPRKTTSTGASAADPAVSLANSTR